MHEKIGLYNDVYRHFNNAKNLDIQIKSYRI